MKDVFSAFARKMLEPHNARSLDDEADMAAVVATVAGITQTFTSMLLQSRAYIQSGLDPKKLVEGSVAALVDSALHDIFGDQYTPPDTVLGRDHLRPISPVGADWSLEALPDDVRAVLHAAQEEERTHEEAYGFLWRGRTCLWTVPLKPVPLREVATTHDGVLLLVGRKVAGLPLFQVAPKPNSPSVLYEYKAPDIPEAEGEAG